MSIPTLREVITAIVERAETIDPEVLNVYPEPVGDPQLPALVVMPPRFNPTMAFKRGVLKLDFPLLLMGSVAAGTDEAVESLWPYIDWAGDQSILAAFDADPTLGFPLLAGDQPLVNANIIDEIEPLGIQEVAGSQVLQELFPLTVVITNRETP